MKRERRKRPGRPPLDVQYRVALRQNIEASAPVLATIVAIAVREHRLRSSLHDELARLAHRLGCQIADLRLDHDPMLRVRAYRPRKDRPVAGWYSPHAHSADHLSWRPQQPELAGSHHVKTYIRGDHGQYSDTVLAKRERRRERRRMLTKVAGVPVNALKTKNQSPRRFKWPKSRIHSRGFPPKGSRPFKGRGK